MMGASACGSRPHARRLPATRLANNATRLLRMAAQLLDVVEEAFRRGCQSLRHAGPLPARPSDAGEATAQA